MSAALLSGVLLDHDDAAFLAAALRTLVELTARSGGRPVARVHELERQLSAASAVKHSAAGTSERPGRPVPQLWEPQLIETSTAATLLGCSERNVRALAARGTLTAHRIGGRWFVDPADVEARSNRTRGRTTP